MHVSTIKSEQQERAKDACACAVDAATTIKFNNYRKRRICNSSSENGNNNNYICKFIMTTSILLQRLATLSMSGKWRRRRRRRKQQNDNAIVQKATTRTTGANNDNCNYSTTTMRSNDFNKINKLLLITCMLLITTTTICQSYVPGAAAAAAVAPSTSASGEASTSPLSALLKSGGASYKQQLPQQQLFAMLARNNGAGIGLGLGSGNTAALASAAAAPHQHQRQRSRFPPLREDEDSEDAADEEFAGLHIPMEIAAAAAVAAPSSISSASLETRGFVADDGGQYEQAQRALAESAANPNAKNNNNINCPKECKCLNVFFDCDKLHLDRVPVLPSYVQTLHLAGNKLNDSTVLAIRNLPELHKLTLKRNQLDVMPMFVGLTALRQLNLANNRIQRISSGALALLPKLKSLDLSKNQLHSVEANVFPRPNRLAHLILNSNEIASVDELAFAALSNLTDLELSNNRLSSLPVGVFKNLNRLKKLALNYNQLEINWSTFRGLLSLQKLQLKANNIKMLQDGVFHVMRSIESIELDHNGISSLSRQGLFNLTKLHHLSLSNNSITRIELDTWEFTQSLESLDLSHNFISEFKAQHLDCLKRLKTLNLAHNKLQYLPENTFDCVKNLEELNLRRNRLSWIIEDQSAVPPFKALRKLRQLDLNGNYLKQISSKALSGLINLELLNLGGNALASIQPNAFEHMQNLQKLVFKSDNFICDCELLWFRQWLRSRFAKQAQQLLANVVCGYPDQLLDRQLFNLTEKELVCSDSPKPVVQKEPTNLLAVKGANITLECIASSPAAASIAATDELKIKWRHDNQHVLEHQSLHDGASTETQIHHDQRTNQTTIYGYLRLSNVSYESAGRYQCVVSNAFGTTYAQKFKISIGIHPSFLHVPSNLTLDAGETARLVCSASGDPMPEIALQKFGARDFPAATERRLQVIREENAFIITNAKPSDSGIYTCTAESPAGVIKVNATLLVNDKPLPSIPLVHKEVVLGRTCVLECLSETINMELEQQHREWYKENKPLHNSPTGPDAERFYFTKNKEVLVIVNAQSNDAGHYRCDISDNLRTLTLQSELLVVQDSYNIDVVLWSVVHVTICCALIGICIVWSTLRYQRRKQSHSSNQSTLEQTQLTTLNLPQLRPYQSQLVIDGLASVQKQQRQQQQQQQPQTQLRPRSLADLGAGEAQTHSRLIVTTTPSYEQRCLEERLTLSFLQQADLELQQDHLSSKDSGTGSDAAVKRSLEDFVVAMPLRQPRRRLLHEDDDVDDDDVDEADDDNDLQFAPTRALGVSVYDDMELYELNHSAAEQQRFLRNNNHNYDGGGAGVANGGVAPQLTPPAVPRKCSAQLSGASVDYKAANAVDI
ncbi:leucine-rich repeats and immunoglobulin-like domains protein 3 [Drosophila novamexicana]|uniref:leucine-rich repeats and immunoglobulin-like domains protein 3 n=1 Tax=Drosophila novamexicana TaxID=47314 RepID=UPI0011E5F216|nr:leucine-rich repeats and immunoglobulin-like domains protein 3 [Drosophila novamexicana]XP_030567596.1 leucine-rich repeats and immunoglobulin-like domains protein 3 [Drosophila novamexicana]